MNRLRWMGLSAGIFVLIVVISAALLGCGGGEEIGSEITSDDSRMFQMEDADAVKQSGMAAGGAESLKEQESGAQSGSGSAVPQLQLMVIKTALVKMETGKGEYVKIREDAVAVTSSAGGYVESESSSRDDEGYTYASLTLRVPSESFDDVVSKVSALGMVVSTQVSTNDVSGEYVDLESRLKHLQAEEAFYLSLIGKAQSIQEMITIREHLDSIQLEKEQAQGRKNFLDSQISYSTLTLSVDEVSGEEEDGEGFWHSVGEAFKSFGRGLGKLAVGFFYALPYLLILALLALIVWLIVRRISRHHRAGPDTQDDAGN